MAWPNGAKRRYGKFSSAREADEWIKQHRWLTMVKIEEKAVGRPRGRASKSNKLRTGDTQ